MQLNELASDMFSGSYMHLSKRHLSECIAREKTYLVSNLYLKFSELQLLEGDGKKKFEICTL